MTKNGNSTMSQEKIKLAAELFFKSLFKDEKSALISNQLKVLEQFPSFLQEKKAWIWAKKLLWNRLGKSWSKWMDCRALSVSF